MFLFISLSWWVSESDYKALFTCMCLFVYVCICVSVVWYLWKTEDAYLIMIVFISEPGKWNEKVLFLNGFSVGDLGVLEKYFPQPCKLIETYYSMYFITLISRIFLHMTQAEEINWINEEIENKKAKWQNCRSGRGNFCCLNSLVLAHGGIPTSRT